MHIVVVSIVPISYLMGRVEPIIVIGKFVVFVLGVVIMAKGKSVTVRAGVDDLILGCCIRAAKGEFESFQELLDTIMLQLPHGVSFTPETLTGYCTHAPRKQWSIVAEQLGICPTTAPGKPATMAQLIRALGLSPMTAPGKSGSVPQFDASVIAGLASLAGLVPADAAGKGE